MSRTKQSGITKNKKGNIEHDNMDKGSKEVLDALTGHQRREIRKKEKDESTKQKEESEKKSERKKSVFNLVLIVAVLVAFAAGMGWLLTNKEETYTDRDVHWHTLLDINICGEQRNLPHAKSEGPHGVLHTHDDNTIHVEGRIMKEEDIALGKFFDLMDVPFDKDKIMDVENGDLCDGKPGVLKMYVNDQPRDDFRDYIPFATTDSRKQVIKFVFASEEEAQEEPVEESEEPVEVEESAEEAEEPAEENMTASP